MNVNLQEAINPHFFPLLTDKNRYEILRGGAGSGKSHFIAQKFLLRILSDYNKGFKHRFLILRKTLPYAKKSVYPLFKELIYEWGLEDLCTINKTEGLITFSNGSEILISGLDDPEKVKSIYGITSIWMEEATELSVDDFRQLNLRMRGKVPTYYQIVLSFNPVSNLSWVYDEFYNPNKRNRLRDNATLHFSTYKHNLFLDDEYRGELERLEEIDYMWYKVYTLGEWGSLENLIYKKWEAVDDFPEDIQEVVCGLDFGYTHPSSMVMLGIGKEGLYVRELIHFKKRPINELIKRMTSIIPLSEDKPTRNSLNRLTPIYCDSSRPDSIVQIRQAGFNVIPASKGAHSVKEGIDTIKQHKLYITKDSTNIIKEIQQYKWKEDRNGNVFDEPVKLHDDAMDAMRYAAYMTLRKKKQLFVVTMDM
jgi:phage terminase large subunit